MLENGGRDGPGVLGFGTKRALQNVVLAPRARAAYAAGMTFTITRRLAADEAQRVVAELLPDLGEVIRPASDDRRAGLLTEVSLTEVSPGPDGTLVTLTFEEIRP